MQCKIQYNFSVKLWQDSSPGNWCFVSLPNNISEEIRENLQWQEEGWGRMKASAAIGKIEWDTAIWFDKKSNTYLLPVKADIRRKGCLQIGETISVSIWI